ncbi:putative glycerophosphoryl diester phosphodiesterase protein [Botryosphaeria dothidea]|uniref:Glycerophosphoryl diester phosphodiesterase protein n=1 Tax=Botryosphaeria dothidea TaxID=55169 RepID=A0A8H4J4Z0_9PEZI|nr:putative glycerophosphoryl diester phosphodiesterase protein [Botryosphaeria dothidea]
MALYLALRSIVVVVGKVVVYSYLSPSNDFTGRIEVQAHRGGMGMRSEESLWAFAYAMEIGADTLEMDSVFTKDGPDIYETKCTGDYVGEYIKNLTLAQVKSLDCDLQLHDYVQQNTHHGTKIAILEEVLELVNCYGDKDVTINLETKIDPTAPERTWPVEKYIELIPILSKHGLLERTTIQSFDWRTHILIHEQYPAVPLVALLDQTTIVPNTTGGAYPWLGGLNLEKDYDGDWVATAARDRGERYTLFTTKNVVDRANRLGMQVIPGTIDYEVMSNKMIDGGVHSIISNYPERVFAVARQRGLSIGHAKNPSMPECLTNASV